MFNKILKISLIVSTVLIIGCGDKIKVNTLPLSKEDIILSYGDSLTYGMGAKKNESYPEQLQSITGYMVVNAGLNGDTAEGSLLRLKKELAENKPKLVILGLGGNDMLRGKDKQLEENLNLLIKEIKSSGAQVVLLGTPTPNILREMIGSLKDAEVYRKVAKEQQVALIDNVYSKYLSKNKYKSDQIHLNKEGYYLVAKDIAKELKDYGFIK